MGRDRTSGRQRRQRKPADERLGTDDDQWARDERHTRGREPGDGCRLWRAQL